MNPETIDKLKEVFTPVAQKIGEGAQFGYEVVYRQMLVEGFLGLLLAVAGVVFIAAGIYTFSFFQKKHFEKAMNEKEHFTAYIGEWLFLAYVCLLSGAGFGAKAIYDGMYTAITHLVNPHFYAIQFFINLVK